MLLILKVLNFLSLKGIIAKFNRKIISTLMYFVTKIILLILIISDQNFYNHMHLLLISDKNKSHYVYIKDFNKFMYNKTKCRTKEYYSRYCLQCFSSELVLIEHKETCLKINDKQSIKLKVVQLILKIISNN